MTKIRDRREFPWADSSISQNPYRDRGFSHDPWMGVGISSFEFKPQHSSLSLSLSLSRCIYSDGNAKNVQAKFFSYVFYILVFHSP